MFMKAQETVIYLLVMRDPSYYVNFPIFLAIFGWKMGFNS